MRKIELTLDLSGYDTHQDLILDLETLLELQPNDEAFVRILLNPNDKPLYADFLVLIVVCIKYQKNNGVKVMGEIAKLKECPIRILHYASRINFFKELGGDFQEPFTRQSSFGRFIEITNYKNSQDALQVNKQMIEILKASGTKKEVLLMLDYCLFEVLDNVLTHAKSSVQGWAFAQLFPNRNEIRLIIADLGIGIHRGLTEPTDSKFKDLEPQESVVKCTEEGVTGGAGMGNGLYHTKRFIVENGGKLLIYSGEYAFDLENGQESISKVPNWPGTIIFMKIDTTKEVDYHVILGQTSTREDDFQFLFE